MSLKSANENARSVKNAEDAEEMLKKYESTEEQNDGKKLEKGKITILITYETYCVAYPQSVLQAYTLWKRPIHCFEGNKVLDWSK